MTYSSSKTKAIACSSIKTIELLAKAIKFADNLNAKLSITEGDEKQLQGLLNKVTLDSSPIAAEISHALKQLYQQPFCSKPEKSIDERKQYIQSLCSMFNLSALTQHVALAKQQTLAYKIENGEDHSPEKHIKSQLPFLELFTNLTPNNPIKQPQNKLSFIKKIWNTCKYFIYYKITFFNNKKLLTKDLKDISHNLFSVQDHNNSNVLDKALNKNNSPSSTSKTSPADMQTLTVVNTEATQDLIKNDETLGITDNLYLQGMVPDATNKIRSVSIQHSTENDLCACKFSKCNIHQNNMIETLETLTKVKTNLIPFLIVKRVALKTSDSDNSNVFMELIYTDK